MCAYASTDQEIEELRSLIDQIDGKYEYHEEIMDIIEDEAKAYFSGSKNVEEVCKLIQSRVSIYIMEQME